ncbi:hypothetical protein ACHWQZ_G019019 [Mnemiopsis leidyi]
MNKEVVVPALNKEEVDELYALFDKFDDDGNGELELDELSKMMNNLGVIACKDDLKNLLDAIDDDLSGTIDCWELVEYIDRMLADEFTNDELIEAFNMIDSDKGGEISLEELRVAMQSADCGVTKPEMEYLFRKVDRNHDGNISFSEFSRLLRNR